jgi:uncharacterized membrane protein YhdT
MDELELLKKDWKKGNDKYPKLSYNDLYQMILKRSSSIVKWIFIISLLEFVFWLTISFALKDVKGAKAFDELNANVIVIPLTVLGYIILAYFFYKFYINYRTISVTDNAKVLMENILKTRRTVKQYVGFNLAYMAVGMIVGVCIELNQDPLAVNKAHQAAANGEAFMFYGKVILITAVILALLIGLLFLFYWLIYGLLLRKLNRNYKELKKLEV